MVDDPDAIVVPEVKGTGDYHETQLTESQDAKKRRFRVWKTKFWKRRDEYHVMKSEIDANWPVITPNQLGEERT
jgi:hypothetical protein